LSNKTLVILTPGFPANEADSTCLPFPQSFVKNLKKLHPALNIIVLTFQYPFFAGRYEWNGITIHAFNGRNRGKINRLRLWWAVWKKLSVVMKNNRVFGILNLWLGECALIGKLAARKYRINSFTWLLGQDARKGNRYALITKPSPGSLIALSDFICAEYYRNYQVKPAHTILPGIDTSIFSNGPAKRDFDIMGAGSLISLKQYDQFIRVVAGLAVRYPAIKAIICGEGPQRENLQRMINGYNLNGNIELKGERSHAEVLELMQAAKVFLHPSSYEGFSTVCAEALYAGAQVVSYCKPMNKDFNHLHIVTTEPEMAEKVAFLLNNKNSTHEPVLIYSIEDTCREILSVIQHPLL
jgi:glycosyltransferase involved in cell wall biosynthesis